MMKLGYVADGSNDAPLIRLYDFGPGQAARLQAIFRQLATSAVHSIELHEVDFIRPLSDCRLALKVATRA